MITVTLPKPGPSQPRVTIVLGPARILLEPGCLLLQPGQHAMFSYGSGGWVRTQTRVDRTRRNEKRLARGWRPKHVRASV